MLLISRRAGVLANNSGVSAPFSWLRFRLFSFRLSVLTLLSTRVTLTAYTLFFPVLHI
jgi:hypothetical protein